MFAPLWRRKWLILAVGILVAFGTYVYYKRERPSYLATTQVYLGAGAEEQAQISGTGTGAGKKSAGLEPTAQATLINSAIIKGSVREKLHKQHKTRAVRAALKGKTKAKASEKSQFITLSAEARDRRGAALLANLTAQTYVTRENDKYKREVEAAISLTRRQLRRIETSAALRSAETSAPAGKTSKGAPAKSSAPSAAETLQAANLSSKINELEADLAIVNVRQIDPAKPKSCGSARLLAENTRDLRVRRRAAAGRIRRLRAGPARQQAALTGRDRSGVRDRDPDRAADRRAIRSCKRTEGAAAGEDLCGSPCSGCTPACRSATSTSQNGRGRPRTILFVSAEAGDGKSTVVGRPRIDPARRGRSGRDRRGGPAQAGAGEAARGRAREPGLAEVLEGKLTVREAIQDVGAVAATPGPQGAQAPAGGDRDDRRGARHRVGIGAGWLALRSPTRPRCWQARR